MEPLPGTGAENAGESAVAADGRAIQRTAPPSPLLAGATPRHPLAQALPPAAPTTTGAAAPSPREAHALATASGNTRAKRQRGRRKRRGRKQPPLRADGAPRDSDWMAVRWSPPQDVFPPFCEHCGERVSVMTRHERVMATNRALHKHAAPFVSHVVMPGPKKGKLAGSSRDSARSIISLNSIASERTIDTMRSGGSRRSFRSRGSSAGSRRFRNSPRGSVDRGSFSLGALSSNSSRRGGRARSRASGARSGVSQLTHSPRSVTYIPGCGFFCGRDCVHRYVLSNVGTGNTSDAVKTTKNVKRPAVLQCVRHNNLDQLSFLLRNSSDIHILADNRQTLLHVAAGEGHVRVLDRLFAGAFNVVSYQLCVRHHPEGCACYNQRLEVNRTDMDGSTPLHIAAQKGQRYALERLLAAGGDPELLDYSGRAPHDVASAFLVACSSCGRGDLGSPVWACVLACVRLQLTRTVTTCSRMPSR